MKNIRSGPCFFGLTKSLHRTNEVTIPDRVLFEFTLDKSSTDQCAAIWAVISGLVVCDNRQGYYTVTGIAMTNQKGYKGGRKFRAIYNPDTRNGPFEFID